MSTPAAIEFVASQFSLPGRLLSATPYGGGHINDSYLLEFQVDSHSERFLLQRLNSAVFPNALTVMENVARVVEHIARKERESDKNPAQILQLIPANDRRPFFVDQDGSYWRIFTFIADSYSLDTAEKPLQVYEASVAFGRFACLLSDLQGPRLQATIPGFHDTGQRYQQLSEAIGENRARRLPDCQTEVEFAQSRSELADKLSDGLLSGSLPEWITHNDSKLNNVLLANSTHRGVCVVDLDTVMPGSILFDIGDLLRSATMTAPEDCQDIGEVHMDRALFEAVIKGYIESLGHLLEPAEKSKLGVCGKVLSYETGIRFLADYLNGDRYFKTAYPEHNLVRCRTQFALLRSMEDQTAYMDSFIAEQLAASATA